MNFVGDIQDTYFDNIIDRWEKCVIDETYII